MPASDDRPDRTHIYPGTKVTFPRWGVAAVLGVLVVLLLIALLARVVLAPPPAPELIPRSETVVVHASPVAVAVVPGPGAASPALPPPAHAAPAPRPVRASAPAASVPPAKPAPAIKPSPRAAKPPAAGRPSAAPAVPQPAPGPRTPAPGVPEYPAFAGLVSWWPGDGDAHDVRGGNDAAIAGDVGYAPGVAGEAFQFGGKDGGVLVPDGNNLKITGSLTLSAWVKAMPMSSDRQHVIIFRGDTRPGYDPYVLAVKTDGSNRVVFAVSAANNQFKEITAPLPMGRFVYLAGTLDDHTGLMRLYVDGQLAAEAVTPIRPFPDLDPSQNPGIGIGNTQRHGMDNQFFHGLIDEVQIYDRALTPTEIRTTFEAGATLLAGR